MNEDQAALANFKGTARLLPLPSLVLFPHAVQPLHIFEQRYRQMTADALADDRLIALVLLHSGWEPDYDDRPAIHPVACLGRIVADQMLPDGRYNLLLRGLTRIRILDEIHDDKLYRTANVELMSEGDDPPMLAGLELRQRLEELVMPRFSGAPQAKEQLQALFDGELLLGSLCDILGFALPLPLDQKQMMLEQGSVAERATMIINALAPPPGRRFPPDFSKN